MTGLKTSARAAKAAKAAGSAGDEVASFATKNAQAWAKAAATGDDAAKAAATAKIDRVSDLVATAAKAEDGVSMKGLAVVARAHGDDAATLASKPLHHSRREIEFVGQHAVRHGDGAADHVVRTVGNGDQTTTLQLGQAHAKATKFAVEGADALPTYTTKLLDQQVTGVGGLVASATKMAPKQAKGHVFHLKTASKWLDEGKPVTKLDFKEKVIVNGKQVEYRPDIVTQNSNGRSLWEVKDVAKLNLDKRAKLQIDKMKQFADDHASATGSERVIGQGIVVRNGEASQPALRYAGERGIPVLDETGRLLNSQFYTGSFFW